MWISVHGPAYCGISQLDLKKYGVQKAWVGEKVVYPSIHVVCASHNGGKPDPNAAMGTETLF